MDEPDSFERQKEALFRLARRLKRVPTLQEALHFLREEHLYSGHWDDNLAGRKARVRSILKFIARTFDPGRCGNGSVHVGKYDVWAKKHFPNGLRGRGRRGMTEDGQVVETEGVHVGPDFIAVFLAVCEFALLIDKNQDDTLPHRRAEQVWHALYGRGVIAVRFCARKWAVCREELVPYGIVQITDRSYGPGKAMAWAVGTFFPFLGRWKTARVASLQGPGCLTRKRRATTQQHNTLLRQQSAFLPVNGPLRRSRPPPGPNPALV
ncbi:MAG TPA: hypothetical protein VG013_15760 [Gemmataceae bacterium]|nr:hypothetical protein [Gemmataceae bacterium]